MSNVDTIIRNRDRFRGRDFRFVRSISYKTKEFRCDICKLKGKKGCVLEDHAGQIRIGDVCFRDNFTIRANEPQS